MLAPVEIESYGRDRGFSPLRVVISGSSVRVKGEVDALTAGHFDEILNYYRSMDTIDLSGITFFASAGADVLEAWAHEHGDRPRLIASDPIRRVLDILEIEGVVTP